MARAKSTVKTEEVIRIGTSPITPSSVLMELWPKVRKQYPNMKFQLVPFENTPENAREILKNLGQNIDVVAGIFDETLLEVRQCAGIELRKEPICCAVSLEHPLAEKKILTLQDLEGENLLLMHRGWSHHVDELRDDLKENYSLIHIVDFDFYNMEIFNRCENSNDILMAFSGWSNVHPLLKIIPVEWDYKIPYGLLHSHQPSEEVQKFLDAIRSITK